MSKEKPIIRVAYLGLDTKINHKELDEIKKANSGCDVRVCLIDTDFLSKSSQSEDLYNQLLKSDIHEAQKGFRIEEIYDCSLLEEMMHHHEQK
jgi:hypothetical protein